MGIAGLAAMVATALTFTFCVPGVVIPKRFISGVKNIGVVMPWPPSRATLTPLAVAIGSL
jgi:hypothetical protein